MTQLSADVARRLEQLPHALQSEFPHIPLVAIERHVRERTWHLAETARFGDFVPLLVHKAVRERLRATN